MAWNRPTSNTGNATSSSRPTGRGKMPRLRRGIIAGLVTVVALGAVCYFMFGTSRHEAERKPEKKPSSIKDVKPAVAPKAQTNLAASLSKPETPKKMYRGHVIVSEAVKTNGNIIITERVTEDGQVLRRIGKKENRIFETASDDMLAYAVQMRPGIVSAPMPPPGVITEADFLKSLEKPIIVTRDDSPEDAELKRKVKQARLEMKDAIDAGYKFADVLRDFEQRHNDSAELTQEIRREYRKLIDEGETEAAEVYLKRTNVFLKQHGAEEVAPGRGTGRSANKNEGDQQ